MTNEQLFEKYRDLAKGAVTKYFGQDIERKYYGFGITFDDLVQIGYLAIWKNIDIIEDKVGVQTYIYNCVWMAIKHYMRQQGALIKMPVSSKYETVWTSCDVLTDDGTSLVEFIPEPCETYREAENRVFFEQIIAYLNKKDAALVRTRLTGLNLEETARALGLSRQAIQQREKRIFRDIREVTAL